MNAKELELWAEYIGTEIPYSEYKQIVADAVIAMAKKTRKSFTDKAKQKFLEQCIYWETNRLDYA